MCTGLTGQHRRIAARPGHVFALLVEGSAGLGGR